MEQWSLAGSAIVSRIIPLLHYSITPLLHYSACVRSLITGALLLALAQQKTEPGPSYQT
jgi:hypothetical protein